VPDQLAPKISEMVRYGVADADRGLAGDRLGVLSEAVVAAVFKRLIEASNGSAESVEYSAASARVSSERGRSILD